MATEIRIQRLGLVATKTKCGACNSYPITKHQTMHRSTDTETNRRDAQWINEPSADILATCCHRCKSTPMGRTIHVQFSSPSYEGMRAPEPIFGSWHLSRPIFDVFRYFSKGIMILPSLLPFSVLFRTTPGAPQHLRGQVAGTIARRSGASCAASCAGKLRQVRRRKN